MALPFSMSCTCDIYNVPQVSDTLKICDNLSQLSPITDTCYVSNILTVGSEPVISFFNEGKFFFWICLFCIFVRNKIYVLEVEMLEPVFMARKHKSGNVPNLIPTHMISQVFPEVG